MKIIKTEKEYNSALVRIETLVDIDPKLHTAQADELELLVLLVNKYEEEKYTIQYPDPIDAIKFRMEQLQLKNKDLVAFIGSKSKVSEILNKKRSLSLSMIRKLHEGLDIPASILISDSNKIIPEKIEGIVWKSFPIAEMIKNNWIEFNGSLAEAKDNAEELIRDFFSSAKCELQPNTIFYRKSIRSDAKINEYNLSVWFTKAIIDQNDIKIAKKFNKDDLTDNFLDQLRKSSIFDSGPVLARELLQKIGIKLVIVPNLKGMHIDGASFLTDDEQAVIILSLRYDRIDYFWFTLFHELGHMKKHIFTQEDIFFDDLNSSKDITKAEKEADSFSENHLILKKEWQNFYSDFLTEKDVLAFANNIGISPAIVIGRVQKIKDDYRFLRPYLGQNKIRCQFNLA